MAKIGRCRAACVIYCMARLTGISDAGRQLLQTAVVIGRSFDLDTLRAASGRSEEETVTALEELIAQRLIHDHRRWM